MVKYTVKNGFIILLLFNPCLLGYLGYKNVFSVNHSIGLLESAHKICYIVVIRFLSLDM